MKTKTSNGAGVKAVGNSLLNLIILIHRRSPDKSERQAAAAFGRDVRRRISGGKVLRTQRPKKNPGRSEPAGVF